MTDIELAVCMPCVNGLHAECLQAEVRDEWIKCCCPEIAEFTGAGHGKEKGRPESNPEDITDVLSTGRKRAAQMYPIYDGMVCEWAGLAFAGGGVEPIIGCEGNLLYNERGKYARHHGPDKNTLENSPNNVHRICYTCHNRWHAANNEYYGERPKGGQPYLPIEGVCLAHDSETKATPQEIADNEIYWKSRKIQLINETD
jgi:hypothetical protein